MVEKSTIDANDSADSIVATTPLYMERQGPRQYVARNSRGAEVEIGDGPGRFSPGDLLKIALGGCNAMSSDQRLQTVLSENFSQIIGISGTYNEDKDRFESFMIELIQDLSPLSENEHKTLVRRADSAINRNCTIGHTLEHGIKHSHTFTSEQVEDDE